MLFNFYFKLFPDHNLSHHLAPRALGSGRRPIPSQYSQKDITDIDYYQNPTLFSTQSWLRLPDEYISFQKRKVGEG